MNPFVKPKPVTAMVPNWGKHALSNGAGVRVEDGGDADAFISVDGCYFSPSHLRELADNLRELADVMEGKE